MKSSFDELRSRLDQLMARRERLADHLESAAERLACQGERPPNELLLDLGSFRAAFSCLANDMGVTETLSEKEDVRIGALSLKDLDSRLDWNCRVEKSLGLLDQALRLRHRDGTVPLGLRAVIDDARIIQQRLSSWPDVDPQVVGDLSNGTHPIAQVLKMAGDVEHLSDQQWHEAAENLCDAYGRELSITAARGHLTFEANCDSVVK